MTTIESPIETQRLLLRRWTPADATALYALAKDPDVGPRAGWPVHASVEESRRVIETVFGNNYTWAVVLKATGKIIGCMGYYPPGESNIDIGENEAEVGYWMGKPYWNKGYATEALGAMVAYCFKVKGFQTLWADCFAGNKASARVMEKCGFADTGRKNYCSKLLHGKDTPVCIMRLDA